jgi:hypothetical protein
VTCNEQLLFWFHMMFKRGHYRCQKKRRDTSYACHPKSSCALRGSYMATLRRTWPVSLAFIIDGEVLGTKSDPAQCDDPLSSRRVLRSSAEAISIRSKVARWHELMLDICSQVLVSRKASLKLMLGNNSDDLTIPFVRRCSFRSDSFQWRRIQLVPHPEEAPHSSEILV